MVTSNNSAANRTAKLESQPPTETAQHRQLQAELHIGEATTRALIESIPGGVLQVAANGSIVLANRTAQQLLSLGYDPQLDCYLVERWTDSCIWASDSPLARCLATGEPQPAVTLDLPNAQANQTTPAICTAVPIADTEGICCGAWLTFFSSGNLPSCTPATQSSAPTPSPKNGKPSRATSTAAAGNAESRTSSEQLGLNLLERPGAMQGLDLTNQKTAEAQFRFQAQLLDNVRESVVASNLEGRIIYWSKGAEQLYGFRPEEAIGQMSTLVVPAGDQQQHFARLQQARETGSWVGECIQERQDGTLFWTDAMIGAVLDEQGQLCGFVGIDRDATLRRQTEDALRESERRLRQMVEHLPAGAVFVEGEEIIINHEVERITGYSRAELTTLDAWFTKLFRESAAEIRGKYHRSRTTGQLDCPELAIFHKEGDERWIEFTGYRDQRGEVWILHDVTERKNAEELLRRREAELAHVNRLSTMGEMVAEIAHEINQPLYAITNFADACATTLETNHDATARPVVEWTRRIREQASRAGEIIRRLRKFVGSRSQLRAALDLGEVIRESLDLLAIDARRQNIRVVLESAETLPVVMADPIQIQQVLVNLIRNAYESLHEVQSGDRRVVIRTSRDQHQVRVEVEDTGHGICDEQVDRVFDPFFTTKSEGMGMGLPISRTIIDAHGGHLWASSNPERGMTFCFTLPAAEDVHARPT